MNKTAIAALAGGCALLSGCVAAAVPVIAGAAVAGRHHIDGRPEQAPLAARYAPPADRAASRPASGPTSVADLPTPQAPTTSVPPAMQYLYGSGEAAALSIQSYFQLADFVIAKSSDRAIGHDVTSVVLAPGATLADPKFEDCGSKPLAMVLDIDETALLNLGFEENQAETGKPYDQQRWDQWERSGAHAVAAVPGAIDAVTMARKAHVTVIFNSDRTAANASATVAAIAAAGLGQAVHGDTLWLKGDAGGGSGKDARRQAISAKYCVIAMAGDQLGDFSDLFNAPALDPQARRAIVANRNLELIWGEGWFMLPNPAYGSALRGGFDAVFPADKRWAPAADANPNP